jgi:hypothetical protein
MKRGRLDLKKKKVRRLSSLKRLALTKDLIIEDILMQAWALLPISILQRNTPMQ